MKKAKSRLQGVTVVAPDQLPPFALAHKPHTKLACQAETPILSFGLRRAQEL
jgi:hypothetical protein